MPMGAPPGFYCSRCFTVPVSLSESCSVRFPMLQIRCPLIDANIQMCYRWGADLCELCDHCEAKARQYPFPLAQTKGQHFPFRQDRTRFSVKLRNFCFKLTFYSRSQMLGANVSAKGQNTVHQCSCSDLLRSRTHVRFVFVVFPVDYFDHTGTTATYARSAR